MESTGLPPSSDHISHGDAFGAEAGEVAVCEITINDQTWVGLAQQKSEGELTPTFAEGIIVDLVALGAQQHANSADDSNRTQRRRPFFISAAAITAMSIMGMGMATFSTLAGGQIGETPVYIFEGIGFAAVDIALMCDGKNILKREIAKRGLCWLAIHCGRGALFTLNNISIDRNQEGTAWQLEPFIY